MTVKELEKVNIWILDGQHVLLHLATHAFVGLVVGVGPAMRERGSHSSKLIVKAAATTTTVS